MESICITLESQLLRRGLFVTALDRPWGETDFLFQGFLIETDEDLAKLQNTCAWVVVDVARSNPDATQGLSVPARAGKRSARATRLPASSGIVHNTAPVIFSDLLAPPARGSRKARTERAKRLLEHTRTYIEPLPDGERASEIPSHEPLVRYVDAPRPLRKDLPDAASAVKAAHASLAQLAEDILKKGELQLANIESTANDLTESIVVNPNALSWLLRARKSDASTYTHNVTAAIYLLTLGRHLGYPPQRLVQFATMGLLLDIGKLFVDRVLLVRPGPLNQDELQAVQRHVELGLAALTPSGDLDQAVVDGIAQHHEWIDGSGYPKGLKGSEISMEGRMAAIADSFAAMTMTRPYAPSLTGYQAMRELYRQAGTYYQESLIDKFVQAVGMFPVGAMVELSGGEIAVVVRHNQQRRLEPCVLVLTDPFRKPLDTPYELDLLTQRQLTIEHKLTRISRVVPPSEFDVDLSRFYIG